MIVMINDFASQKPSFPKNSVSMYPREKGNEQEETRTDDSSLWIRLRKRVWSPLQTL